MLGDVAGIGALKSSIEDMKGQLTHTNELLAGVLVELQHLNRERMAAVVDELHEVNVKLERVTVQSVV
ncbi:MAG: hypothetical protein M3Y19_02290 [Actinomycetota bacterium]|nr:hypothetical protein [Actinomycetota bacterium]